MLSSFEKDLLFLDAENIFEQELYYTQSLSYTHLCVILSLVDIEDYCAELQY